MRWASELGFGRGGDVRDRALQLRRLAAELPLGSLVMETDSPTFPALALHHRCRGQEQEPAPGRNPAELPRIAQVVADLRGMAVADRAQASTANACADRGCSTSFASNGL